MSKSICENAIQDYLVTLKSLFEVRSNDGSYLLVTPYQRPDGDYIEIEVKPEAGGRIAMSDNGDSMNFLFASGLDLSDGELKDTLTLITSQVGVEIVDDEIRLTTSQDKMGRALYSLLNAVLAASHLAYRKQLVKLPLS